MQWAPVCLTSRTEEIQNAPHCIVSSPKDIISQMGLSASAHPSASCFSNGNTSQSCLMRHNTTSQHMQKQAANTNREKLPTRLLS